MNTSNNKINNSHFFPTHLSLSIVMFYVSMENHKMAP